MEDKAGIRKTILRKRSDLSKEVRLRNDKQIASRLESLKAFKRAETILFYYSHDAEVDTLNLIKKYQSHKKLYLPRLTSDSSFLPLAFQSDDELEVNSFGIPEPKRESALANQLDLIIVPGVAFDSNGHRIGMGKGYYDRFLVTMPGVLRVALAYSEQILDQVPKEPYDENVHCIVTEKEIIQCKSSP